MPQVVALITVAFNTVLIPRVSKSLTAFRLGIRGEVTLDTKEAIRFFQIQVQVMLLFEVIVVLLSPMISVFLLDEACLR